MRYGLALLSVVGLAACASTSPPAGPAYVEREVGYGGSCAAAPVQRHVGDRATQEMGAAILAESGARVLRWGPPNSAWTMDYRQDRVNVRYDEAMQIVAITCG